MVWAEAGASPCSRLLFTKLEGRPEVWRTLGPFRETAVPGVSPQRGWAGALKRPVAGLQPLHVAWHSAEVGRAQGGSRWSQEGAVATGKLRPWADLTTDLGYTTALSEPQCPHGGERESPVPAIHCVAQMVGSVALTLQRVQGVILNMNTGLILAQITRGWTPVLLFIIHMLSNVQIPSWLPHLNLCIPTHLHIGTPHSSIQTHLQIPLHTFISPCACTPSSTHASTPHPITAFPGKVMEQQRQDMSG